MGYSLPSASSGGSGPALSGARGLALSASGTSSMVGIAATEAVCTAAGQTPIHLGSVTLTLNMATLGANGLDTGALAASTWYAVFIIAGPSGTAALASLSPTAPALPAGYTVFSRVGWIRTDGSASMYPMAFTQAGSRVQYTVTAAGNVKALPGRLTGLAGTFSATAPVWEQLVMGTLVPPTASAVRLAINNNNTGVTPLAQVFMAPNPNFGGIASASQNIPPIAVSLAGAEIVECELNLESSSIYVVSSTGAMFIACIGWEDAL